MSDRPRTELKFNEFRAVVLPELMINWNELSNASSLLNFFFFLGGLHSKVHLAEACNISLAEAEEKKLRTVLKYLTFLRLHLTL